MDIRFHSENHRWTTVFTVKKTSPLPKPKKHIVIHGRYSLYGQSLNELLGRTFIMRNAQWAMGNGYCAMGNGYCAMGSPHYALGNTESSA